MVNVYLLKIAEMVYNKDTSLPYRRRVEVAILNKDGKVLLTKNKNKDTGEEWYGFPGGGTEGDKDIEAARKECLEEVGIAVTDLNPTSVLHTQEGINDKKGRAEKYRGSKTRVFSALYDRVDKSLLGDDDDAVKYVWKNPSEAEELLGRNKVDSSYRVKAMKEGLRRYSPAEQGVSKYTRTRV